METLAIYDARSFLLAYIHLDSDGNGVGTVEWAGTASSFRAYDDENRCLLEGRIPEDLKLNTCNMVEGETITIRGCTQVPGEQVAPVVDEQVAHCEECWGTGCYHGWGVPCSIC